jgi:hypothetical protein
MMSRRMVCYAWDALVLLGVPLGTLLGVLWWFGVFTDPVK